MSHYKGSATLTQQEGTPVGVYVFYDGSTNAKSDSAGWSGWFSDEDPPSVLTLGAARIELLDGRIGAIVIDQREVQAPYGGHFRGEGPEP